MSRLNKVRFSMFDGLSVSVIIILDFHGATLHGPKVRVLAWGIQASLIQLPCSQSSQDAWHLHNLLAFRSKVSMVAPSNSNLYSVAVDDSHGILFDGWVAKIL
jgi:hypothetical protein